MHWKSLLPYSFSLFFLASLSAQTAQPSLGWLYDDQSLSKIDVYIDSDSLQAILDPANVQSDHEYPATFVFTRNGQTDSLFNIGFRLRGNTSRNAQKKSFKVAINSFTSGRRYQDVKKINLNGEHNDPSISRARMCWKFGRQFGLPVSRVNHTELYVNNRYRGVYINVEHINDDWLALRYGNNSGNLYKCVWPADLDFISNNPDDYKFTRNDGRRAYELKTNEQQDDYSSLANFIDILNNTSLNQLECELDAVFDIEGFLEILAFEVSTGHWDNYAYNKNNYYLYQNPETGKMHYIPYDMDNTLGVDWLNEDWAQRDVLNWPNPNMNLPLAQRLLQIPQLEEIYKFYLKEINNKMGDQRFLQQLDSIKNQIDAAAQLDSFRSFDYGFSYSDFQNSFTGNQQLGHVKESIGNYIARRVNNTQQQLGSFNVAPIIRDLEIQWTSASAVKFSARIQDEGSIQAQVEYSINGGSLISSTMLDDGIADDGIAGNGIYGCLITNLIPGASMQYQILASDASNRERRRPCSPQQLAVPQSGNLLINELQADNESTIADEDGDYSDWIELYNNSSDSIWLGEYFLTDDLQQPFKWALPSAYIGSGEFQLVWASNKSGQYPWHTNFALSRNGEEVGLFKDASGQADTIDMILFGAQAEDQSFGRSYDASPVWVNFNTPTPDASNSGLSIEDYGPTRIGKLSVFPNPANDFFSIDWKSLKNLHPKDKVQLSIVNKLGQSVYQWNSLLIDLAREFSVQDFTSGIYTIRLEIKNKGIYQNKLIILGNASRTE